MNIQPISMKPALVVSILVLAPFSAHGLMITPTDLNALALGASIVGPVGPTVDASFLNAANDSLGDMRGGVACPAGFAVCAPPANPAGTIYTYIYEIAPGVDAFANDPPFPQPPLASPAFDQVVRFQLDLAPGSNGVAGFDFAQANNALGNGADFQIDLLNDVLTWTVSGGNSDWNTGEIITFFWQTTQPPTGPGNVYAISNASDTGHAVGPSPAPLPVVSPGSLSLLGLFLPLLGRIRRVAHG